MCGVIGMLQLYGFLDLLLSNKFIVLGKIK